MVNLKNRHPQQVQNKGLQAAVTQSFVLAQNLTCRGCRFGSVRDRNFLSPQFKWISTFSPQNGKFEKPTPPVSSKQKSTGCSDSKLCCCSKSNLQRLSVWLSAGSKFLNPPQFKQINTFSLEMVILKNRHPQQIQNFLSRTEPNRQPQQVRCSVRTKLWVLATCRALFWTCWGCRFFKFTILRRKCAYSLKLVG